MKDFYKISEIVKLYDIGADSLRYYEKIGAIQPKRGENGYRLYSLHDIYKLNIIRDLRQLGFSMEQIKRYLKFQNIENTMVMLEEERCMIRQQMKKLRSIDAYLRTRVRDLNTYMGIETDTVKMQSFPERPCVQFRGEAIKDEEIDFAIKRLHKKHEDKMRSFGKQPMGASLLAEDMEQGSLGTYRSVFLILEGRAKVYDFKLPEGDYLTLFYRGSYRQMEEKVKQVLNFAKAHKMQTAKHILEFYWIDNHDTTNEEEFVTEIQVRIEPERGGADED